MERGVLCRQAAFWHHTVEFRRLRLPGSARCDLGYVWNEEGHKQKCTRPCGGCFSPSGLQKYVCAFLLFLFIGPFIYGLQLNQHNALGGSLGCLPKSSSMFWPSVLIGSV